MSGGRLGISYSTQIPICLFPESQCGVPVLTAAAFLKPRQSVPEVTGTVPDITRLIGDKCSRSHEPAVSLGISVPEVAIRLLIVSSPSGLRLLRARLISGATRHKPTSRGSVVISGTLQRRAVMHREAFCCCVPEITTVLALRNQARAAPQVPLALARRYGDLNPLEPHLVQRDCDFRNGL